MKQEHAETEFEARRREIQRRRQQKKKKRRRVLFKRLCILLAVAAVITLAVLSLTVFFPVQNITVEGTSPYSAEEIVKASGIVKGQNLFLSGGSAEQGITATLPYISKVTVKRKFPSTIRLCVETASPAVCYQTESAFYLCDAAGKLLERKTEQPESVLLIIGSTVREAEPGQTVFFEKEDVAQLILKLRAALADQSVPVDMLDVTDSLDISLRVDGRISVRFGSSANLTEKIAHLAEMISNIDSGLSGKIDLSYWTADSPRGIFTQSS